MICSHGSIASYKGVRTPNWAKAIGSGVCLCP
jgi:hypothetical protein